MSSVTYRSGFDSAFYEGCFDLDGWGAIPTTVFLNGKDPHAEQRPDLRFPQYPTPSNSDGVIRSPAPQTEQHDSCPSTNLLPHRLGSQASTTHGEDGNGDDDFDIDPPKRVVTTPKRRCSKMKGCTDQEILERRRERNRIAAATCRQKKLSWEKNLEFQAMSLRSENAELSMLQRMMREEQILLQEQILKHGWESPDCNNSGFIPISSFRVSQSPIE